MQDETRAVPGADRDTGALAGAGGTCRAGLPEAGSRSEALPAGRIVAHALHADLLRSPPSRGQALSDSAMEDLLYGTESVRRFCGLMLNSPIPDESTILQFRHLFERPQLGAALLETIYPHLAGQGLQAGTIVEASIIAVWFSTENQVRARDPEMHQTRKGNEWHFEMKLHIGVDAQAALTQSLSTTAANTADVTEVHRFLHGAEREA